MGSLKNHGRILRAVAVAAAAGLAAALATGATDASASPGAIAQAGTAQAGTVQAGTVQASTATTAAAQVPVLKWTACDGGFQCATARVPLDYRYPGGAKISIAVVRHLATDPAHRIGSLFVNGGGPGEQIQPFLEQYPGFPAVLRERYDIIFFDPRGFGFSTAVRCFPDATAENKFLSGLPPFPVGAKQDTAWERTYPGSTLSAPRQTAPCLTMTPAPTWRGTWTCCAPRSTTQR